MHDRATSQTGRLVQWAVQRPAIAVGGSAATCFDARTPKVPVWHAALWLSFGAAQPEPVDHEQCIEELHS